MCCYSSAGWFRAFLRCTQTSVLFRYFSKRCLSRTRATWCRTPISSSDGCVQSRHRHGDSRFSRDGRTPVSRNRKGLSDFLTIKEPFTQPLKSRPRVLFHTAVSMPLYQQRQKSRPEARRSADSTVPKIMRGAASLQRTDFS